MRRDVFERLNLSDNGYDMDGDFCEDGKDEYFYNHYNFDSDKHHMCTELTDRIKKMEKVTGEQIKIIVFLKKLMLENLKRNLVKNE